MTNPDALQDHHPEVDHRLHGWRTALLLAAGVTLSLLSVGGQWDVPLAGWLAAVPLLLFTRTTGPVAGPLVIFGIGVVAGVFWLFQTGQGFGLALIGMVSVISAILTIPYLLDRLTQVGLGALPATLVFPVARVCAEYLDALINPAGTIYGSLAATQHAGLTLLQIASVTGSYGVTFLIAWFASCTATALLRRRSWRRVAVPFVLTMIMIMAAGSARLAFQEPTEQSVRVAAVTPQRGLVEARDEVLMTGGRILGTSDKKKPISPILRKRYTAVNDDLIASTERAARAGAKIIVWPEGGGATTTADRGALLDRVGTVAEKYRAHIEVAFGEFTEQPPYMRNEAVLIDPEGRPVWTFDKAHPAPGEPFTPGDGVMPTRDTDAGRLGTLICFDADFPSTAQQGGRDGVDILMLPSNDWRAFGASHTDKAVFRAVENGYSLIRADVKGVSRIYDPQGRTLAESSYFRTDRTLALADVPIHGQRTIYGLIGDGFAWLNVAVLLFAAAVVIIRGAAAARRNR